MYLKEEAEKLKEAQRVKEPVVFYSIPENEDEKPREIARYDWNRLNLKRYNDGERFFVLEAKMQDEPPKNMNEMQVAVDRDVESRAFNAILLRPRYNDKGIQEGYKPYNEHESDNILDELFGQENVDKLEQVKADFFTRRLKLWTIASIQLSKNITDFANLLKASGMKESQIEEELLSSNTEKNSTGKPKK